MAGLLISGNVIAACDQLSIDTSTGTVTDTGHNLTWSRCLVGQAGQCLGDGAALTWVDALNKARGFELGGISNWRLPKIEELQGLFKSGCVATAFPGTGTAAVWSASANLDYATDAWAFDFGKQEAIVFARDTELRVILVSGPN